MQSFWQDKTVLITGHTGFKGSWLSLWLSEWGAKVVGYALPPPTAPNLFDKLRLATRMTSVIGDIRDAKAVQAVMDSHRPDIVIHMAAQSLVRYSYQAPVETYATNVMGTVNVLEAVRHCPSVKAVVNVTTDKCYENQEWCWGYREHEPMGGYDPYSNSKACAELVTAAYRNSFFNPQQFEQHGVALASARAGNVIGGGDWAQDRLIPDIVRSCEMGRDVVIRHPHAIRPWQHVLEPLSGYLALAQALYEHPTEYAQAWNFGPKDSDAKPVQWIVDYLLQAWGDSRQVHVDADVQPHEANFLKLDCSKAKVQLDWCSRWCLTQALDAVVEWHKADQAGADLWAVSQAQWQRYLHSTTES